jgi:DnaJ-class molecular chaperone
MTKSKTSFLEVIALDNLKLYDAGEGMTFTEFPSGNPITIKKARYMLTIPPSQAGFAQSTYVGSSIDKVITDAFKDGKIDLHKYGYNTCHRCSGTGKLSHYSHIHSGSCFKCNGIGVI